MSNALVAVLDAFVIVNFALCDTLLRFAEFPSLYEPRWSEEIMAETVRTLETKLGWPGSLAAFFQSELRTHFADAWVSGYEPFVSEMTNDPKDRHVAAAAVHCKAEIIVTFNLKHFRLEHLLPWNLSALHPDEFLIALYQQNPDSS